jgi:hypothetical protein
MKKDRPAKGKSLIVMDQRTEPAAVVAGPIRRGKDAGIVIINPFDVNPLYCIDPKSPVHGGE